MRWRNISLVWCGLMCFMTPAKAHEVQLGLDQTLGVQSNLFGTQVNEQSDGYYRITPRLIVAQPESDLTYRFEYRPTYSAYFNYGQIDGWDQSLVGRAEYQFDGRDAIVFDTEYVLAQSIRGIGTIDASGQPLVVPNVNGTTQRFVVNLGLDHNFSERTVGSISFNYNRWDYSEGANTDNQGIGAETQLTRAVREKLIVGANVSGRYRSFDATAFAPASYSTVLNANLLLKYYLSPTLRFDVSGGPAGVFTQQSVPGSQSVNRWNGIPYNPAICFAGQPCGRVLIQPAFAAACATSSGIPVLRFCPPSSVAPVLTGNVDEQILVPLDPNQNVFGQSTSDLTYFISVGITKSYRRGSITASFIRNEDAGSGVGATTILNSVTARVTHSLGELWGVSLYGVYSKRTSVSQLPFTDVAAVPAVDSTNAPILDSSGNQLLQAGFLIAQAGISNFDQTIGVAEFRLNRQLTKRASLAFLFTYYNQSQSNQGTSTGFQYDNYIGGVSFIYAFDPYKL